MKTGLNLVELATELQRQSEAKRDFVADTRNITILGGDPEVGDDPTSPLKAQIVTAGKAEVFPLNENANRQIAARLKVPQPFYDRMKADHPDLLAHTVNGLFQREPERRMLRTLDGRARAFLSDRYRILDNHTLAEHVLPVLMEMGSGMRVESAQVTESRMYIKAVFPALEGEIKVGDPVQSGILISNSETGLGALNVSPLIYRLVCKNGLIRESGQKRYHVGRAADSEESAYEFFADDTLKADDAAFWLKVRDTVRSALSADAFEAGLQKFRETMGVMLSNPQATIEVVAERFGYTEQERGSILRNLIEGGDSSLYGLVNAITATSQELESYDRATQFERDGGKIIELPKSDWMDLAKAA